MKKFLTIALLLCLLSSCTYNYYTDEIDRCTDVESYDLNLSVYKVEGYTYTIYIDNVKYQAEEGVFLSANCKCIDVTVRISSGDHNMISKVYHFVLEGPTHITFKYDANCNDLGYLIAVFRW